MGSKRNPQIAVMQYFETADLNQARDTLSLARAKVREREKDAVKDVERLGAAVQEKRSDAEHSLLTGMMGTQPVSTKGRTA